MAVDGVEVAGGFVGHDDGWFDDEGSGEGDALLFAAGELDWVVVDAIGETDLVEEFAGGGDAVAFEVEFEGEEDVFEAVSVGMSW